jgi:hypothetical protein
MWQVNVSLYFIVMKFRTGEVATLSYGTCFWDEIEHGLKLDMSMEKVSSQKLIYMFADYEDWRVCPMFMLALYRISGNGRRHITSSIEDDHWMFSHLSMAADPVRKMNSTLRAITTKPTPPIGSKGSSKSTQISGKAKIVQGVDENYTGTSFRIGSINTIINHDDCDYKHAVMRSGHDYSSMCAVFEYTLVSPHLVSTAGRALLNYPSPRLSSTEPRLIFVDQSNVERVTNFMKHLLNLFEEDFNEGEKLWKLGECLLATFIMHFSDFELHFGSHKIMAHVHSTCSRTSVTIEELRQWGPLIKSNFRESNQKRPEFRDVPVELAAYLQNTSIEMNRKFTKLEERMDNIELRLIQSVDLLRQLVNYSTRKRKFSDCDETSHHLSVHVAEEENNESIQINQYHTVDSTDPIAVDPIESNEGEISPATTNLSTKLPQTPLYQIQGNDMSLSTIFKDYFQYQLYLNRYHDSVKSQTRTRINKVVTFMRRHLSKAEDEKMRSLDGNFDLHKERNDICARVVKNVMAELDGLERQYIPYTSQRKQPEKKPTVQAIESRINKLAKQIASFPPPVPTSI